MRTVGLAAHTHPVIDGIDFTDMRCHFDAPSINCSTLLHGCGGFDQHHPWPRELGGPAVQEYFDLCPSHHRRQHALIRTLIENHGVLPVGILRPRRVRAIERDAALNAYGLWVRAGSPRVVSWPCLAARAD